MRGFRLVTGGGRVRNEECVTPGFGLFSEILRIMAQKTFLSELGFFMRNELRRGIYCKLCPRGGGMKDVFRYREMCMGNEARGLGGWEIKVVNLGGWGWDV